LLGIGVLLPWNVFIASVDYFDILYHPFPFMFVLSLFFNIPSMVFMLLHILYGANFTYNTRIVTSFGCTFVAVCAIPIVNHVFHLSKTATLWIDLSIGFFVGTCTAVVFGAVVAMASIFPPSYITAVMTGNGVAGVLAGILRISTWATESSSDSGKIISAVVYFAIAALVMAMCMFGQIVLMNQPYTQYRLSKANATTPSPTLDPSPLLGDVSSENSDMINQEDKRYYSLQSINRFSIFKKIWVEAASVFFVFFVTLSLFPGMTSQIPPKSIRKDLFSILMVFIFQVMDMIGRSLPRWTQIIKSRVVWLFALIRVVFYPLIIFCIKPRIFANDAAAIAIMAVFATSNGYIGTLAMMYGSSSPKLQNYEREAAGTIMSFFLNAGIFTGVLFSFAILYLVEGILPWT